MLQSLLKNKSHVKNNNDDDSNFYEILKINFCWNQLKKDSVVFQALFFHLATKFYII